MKKQHICCFCNKTFCNKGNLIRHQLTIHSLGKSDINCPLCQQKFTNVEKFIQHQSQECHTTTKYDCPVCKDKFTSKYDLMIHLENDCRSIDEKIKAAVDQAISTKVEKLDKSIEELRNKPNNVLQIVCVTNNDNYLDMLSDRIGNFEQAIEYIKECALSDLTGDCKLIEKIYYQNDIPSFHTDNKQSKIIYHNEKNEMISEPKEIFSRKISNNIQNSYLKGINYVINRSLDQKNDPNKLLDQYDIITWNKHIYDLLDVKHQRKLINSLNIPLQTPLN